MKRKILPLAIIPFLVLQGCSCQQRLERLRRQCPECFTQTTDHVRDTLTVPEKILTGSVPWAWLPSGDTVLFQNRRPRGHPPLPRMRQPPGPPAPRRGRGRRTAGPALHLGHSPRSAPVPPQITHYPGLRLADQPGAGHGVINFGCFNSDKKK